MPKKVDMDHTRTLWDEYRQFYVRDRSTGVVQFETGELIITRFNFDPRERNRVNKFGLSYHLPRDTGFSYTMRHDGNLVCKAWLHNGMYMIDHELKTVHRLYYVPVSDSRVPEHLARRTLYAYHGGPGRHWVTGATVGYTKPVKLTKDERQHLKEVHTQCKAAQRMELLPSLSDLWRIPAAARGRLISTGEVDHKIGLSMTFTDMTDYEKAIVAYSGFKKPMMDVEAERLSII